MVQHMKINMAHYITEWRTKTTWFFSIDVENVFDKIQHAYTVKTFNKLRIEGNELNIIKTIGEMP